VIHHRISLRIARYRGGAPFLAALVGPFVLYHDWLSSGTLPGDIGDARWTINLFEHWFRVFKLAEAPSDSGMFGPVANTLGMSDSFLFQGTIHSFFRIAGVGIVTSWMLSLIATVGIGAFGVALVARRLLSSPYSQTVLVMMASMSYPMFGQRGHPQVGAFLLMSWPLLGLLMWSDESSERVARRGFSLACVGFPVAALASWYGFALGAVQIGLILFARWILVPATARVQLVHYIQVSRSSLRRRGGRAAVAGAVLLWAVFLGVHLPARSNVPAMSYSEVVAYSPRISDFVNASLHSGLWSRQYQELFAPVNGERVLGLTFGLAVLFAFSLLYCVATLTRQPACRQELLGKHRSLLAVGLAVFGFIALSTTGERGGPWWLMWRFAPGFENLRVVSRGMVFLTMIAAYVVAGVLEQGFSVLRRASRASVIANSGRIVASALALTLLPVEGYRTDLQGWSRSALLPEYLRQQVNAIRNDDCEYAIVDPSEVYDSQPAWAHQIDGVIVGMLAGKPSLNGYTSAGPISYPYPMSGKREQLVDDVISWSRRAGVSGGICVVGPRGVNVVR
jgi:hypothetical protein